MRKFLLSLVLCFSLIVSCALAVTIDLSEYDLPDLDTGASTTYSNQILYTLNAGSVFVFSSNPLTADSSKIYVPADTLVTWYVTSGSGDETTWSLQDNATDDYADGDLSNYTTITTSNYIVYDTDDSSNIIYQPTQEGGGSTMSQIITDLGTVMTAVLDNATDLVTWITQNPLVYLWVIMAIIIAIIAFVRGFIRGV